MIAHNVVLIVLSLVFLWEFEPEPENPAEATPPFVEAQLAAKMPNASGESNKWALFASRFGAFR
jgi:hypothetical protein